ncbi:MAG TPA: hypothetical protein VLC08_11385, partial [Chitinolyticbacter sp.]|nr:hypothetical protein [Chitinolyticbacter sp.]
MRPSVLTQLCSLFAAVLLAGCGGGSDEASASSAPTPGEGLVTSSGPYTEIENVRPVIVADWQSALIDSERARSWGTLQVLPAHNQRVVQNPPVFSWPLHPPTVANQVYAYDLEVRFPDGAIKRYSVGTNWYLPRELFPAGNYHWRVIGRGLALAGADAVGAWRDFSVTADAVSVFDAGVLEQASTDASWFAAVAATAHPRIVSEADLAALRPFILTQRKVVWDAVTARVAAQASDAGQAPPPMPTITQLTAAQLTTLCETEQRRIEEAALVWRMWRSSASASELSAANAALADAKARLLNLAAWDNTTFTGQDSNTDVAVRHVLWAMVVGFDHLYNALTVSERDTLVRVIAIRAGQLQSRAIGAFRSRERMPLEAHSAGSLITLAATTATMAGEVIGGNAQFSEAQFARLVPLAYAVGHPWGGGDGAYGNGGGYGEWLMDTSFLYLDALHAVTGA